MTTNRSPLARVHVALLVHLACLGGFAAGALAGPISAQAPDPTALGVDEIIARNLEARGGAAALAALRTLVYSEGLYEEGDYEGSGDAMMAFSRPYHRVVGNPASPSGYLEGYDGAAWEWYEDPGVVVRTVGAAAGATRRGTHFDGPFFDYRAKGSTIELGEPDEIGGRLAYRLVVTMRDGFVREYFVDRETFLVTAERRSAPIHAFGETVTSEDRIGDYRAITGPGVPPEGVLFAHSYVETEIATGQVLNRMQWGRIEANRELSAAWWSPPEFERTPLQRFLELLYGERGDATAVLWSYHEFRRAHPEIDTRAGIEAIGYQMLKMGDHDAAIALLEANAADYPESSSSAFGLGRAYATAGKAARARQEHERAVRLDPDNDRARRALDTMPGPRDAALTIRTTTGSERELAAKAQLERLVETYDIEHWIFTLEIVIDAGEPVPHSHPILTVNADYLDDDLAQLATLLHEQFHWMRGPSREAWPAATAEFRELFPDAPQGFDDGGARDARSTIGHLIICDLELQAMTILVGEEKARATLGQWEHYPWVYEQVLTNPKVREVNERFGWVLVGSQHGHQRR